MATLTVTLEPAYGSVRLDVAADPGDGEVTSVNRLLIDDPTDNGSDVRTQAGQLPAAMPLLLRDFEAPLGQRVQYLVWYESSSGLTAAWSQPVTVRPRPGIAGVLTVVGQPNIQAEVPMLLLYEAQNAPEVTVHWPLGAEYPRYVLGPVRARTGSLTIVVDTLAAARQVRTVYSARQPVLLRQTDHPALDMYHIATALRTTPADPKGRQWRIDVDYTEVADPTMPLIGATGWTFGDVAATYETFADVAAAYDSFGDLFVGPVV